MKRLKGIILKSGKANEVGVWGKRAVLSVPFEFYHHRFELREMDLGIFPTLVVGM